MARRYHHKQPGSSKPFFKILLAALIVAAIVLAVRELRLPPPATTEITADLPAIGRKTVITVKAREPRLGLSHLLLYVRGAGLEQRLLGEARPGPGQDGRELTLQLALGKEPLPAMKPGTLTVEVRAQARGTRLRQPGELVVSKTLDVRFDPPSLAPLSPFIHPAQGGAEAVVYEVGATSKRDGVKVGNWFFPGFALPGGPATRRFAFFAAPYDLDVSEEQARAQILLYAEDELGNRIETPFINKYIRRPLKKDVIELKDASMQKVTGEIYARTPELSRKGNLLDDYLQLNGELRRKNMAELAALATQSQRRFLWNETFLPMRNAAVKGSFADRRLYMAGGKQVDTQDHLGFDLASVSQAPVQAANAGRVALARYFGIFGNCVVIDHGFGLMSLSAHLSTIAVKEGDNVSRGQELGRSGATGLAGGDHLHFTLVLHGLPVTPVEWWDDHWLNDRLKAKLGDALPWKPLRN